ncbi:hypothetical protein RJT34_13331 [Clitoria ternatea]|uniref:WRKY domain-containing protein n=1 Tax=Clitoria ternatea TaxID=43366 RepID=A0AAN9JQE7_CLITE
MNQAAPTLLPGSPISVNGSPLREDVKGASKDHQEVKHDTKKRKIMTKWMDQIRVSFDSGLEGAHEDGYNWRKYGQKDILGAKYPSEIEESGLSDWVLLVFSSLLLLSASPSPLILHSSK